MEQPEIKFIRKLIRMRFAAERSGSNKKSGVIDIAMWLERHIQANGYRSAKESKMFFVRHKHKVEYLIPFGKKKLREEFNYLSSIEPRKMNEAKRIQLNIENMKRWDFTHRL